MNSKHSDKHKAKKNKVQKMWKTYPLMTSNMEKNAQTESRLIQIA